MFKCNYHTYGIKIKINQYLIEIQTHQYNEQYRFTAEIHLLLTCQLDQISNGVVTMTKSYIYQRS